MKKTPVTVLGATGAVGQKFVSLLADHPWFEIASLAASARNVGRRYGEAVHWLETTPLPERLADLTLVPADPGIPGVIAFSALDAAVAESIEQRFAAEGHAVVTNARPYRMEPDVPLLVPEVNAGSLDLLSTQRERRGWRGCIVANPNCSTVVLALALAPLQHAFGVERVVVTTMQAVSGAGYPGLPSLDALGNVVPHIGGEEEKMERETQKILGVPIAISAHCNRVAVLDGHTESVSVGLGRRASPSDVTEVFCAFRGPPDVAELPSAPNPPIVVHQRPDRPQPRLDVALGHGMQVSVGRVRECPVLDVRFTVMGHNTIRGAAGAAVLNAEILVARELLPKSA